MVAICRVAMGSCATVSGGVNVAENSRAANDNFCLKSRRRCSGKLCALLKRHTQLTEHGTGTELIYQRLDWFCALGRVASKNWFSE